MKLSLFFAAVLPILVATTENEPSDLCPLKMEVLKNKIESNKDEILQKVEKKSEQEMSDKILNLEKKILESESKADLKFTMLVAMREFSDLAKKMETLEARTEKIDQIAAEVSGMKSILSEMSSGSAKVDSEKKLLEEIKVNSTIRCEKAKLLKLVKLQSGVYFYHTRTEVDWKKARNFCLKNGMDLAILETAEEMKKVADAAPKNNEYYNVGASDLGQVPGHFVWSDGRQLDEALWRSGRPYEFGSGKEACVWLHSGEGMLHDVACSAACYLICELAQKDQLCL